MYTESSFNFKKSRNDLVEKIKHEPNKEKRVEILNTAKKTPEYQISKRLNEIEKNIDNEIMPIETKEIPEGFVDIRSIIPKALQLEIDYYRTKFIGIHQSVLEKKFGAENKLGENALNEENVKLKKETYDKLSGGRFHEGLVLSHRAGVSGLNSEMLNSKIMQNLFVSTGDNVFIDKEGVLCPFMLIGIKNPTFKKSCLIRFWEENINKKKIGGSLTEEEYESLQNFINDYEKNGVSVLDKYYKNSEKTINQRIAEIELMHNKFTEYLKNVDKDLKDDLSIPINLGGATANISKDRDKELCKELSDLKNSKDKLIYFDAEGDYGEIDYDAQNLAFYALLSGKKMLSSRSLLEGNKLNYYHRFFSIFELQDKKIVERRGTWKDITETAIDLAGGTAWYADPKFAEKIKKENNL